MTPHADLRRGWCPGALTPMQTGDGWLVRVKPRAGRFTLAQISCIAECAAAYGNGAIDMTNRANLQIRGLQLDTIASVQDRLRQAALVDDDAGAEARRNVIVTPIGYLTPIADAIDRLAAELEMKLAEAHALAPLPGKFGLAIDVAGTSSAASSNADITLLCDDAGVDVFIAGDSTIAARSTYADACTAALRLASAYLDFGSRFAPGGRMRDVVTEIGAAAIFTAARLVAQTSNLAVAPRSSLIGAIGNRGQLSVIGVGLPFGRIAAADLLRLAAIASQFGLDHARPSTSRSFVFAIDTQRADRFSAAAKAIGLIVDPSDKRTGMDVCPGAPDCERGTTSTRTDAAALADMISAANVSLSVHLSGCAKGCARSRTADVTIIGNEGSYSIVLGGTVSGKPTIEHIAPSNLAAVVRGLIGARHA